MSLEFGDSMLNMKYGYLGRCQYATISVDYTAILTNVKNERLNQRCDQLRQRLITTLKFFEKKKKFKNDYKN